MEMCKLTHIAQAPSATLPGRGGRCGVASVSIGSRRRFPFSFCAVEPPTVDAGDRPWRWVLGEPQRPGQVSLGGQMGRGGGEALDAGPLGVGRKELAGDEKEEGGRCPSLNFLGKQQAG